MGQPLEIVTLGVERLAVSRRFYVAWLEREPILDLEEIVFVQVGHSLLLGLFPASELALDAGLPADGMHRGGHPPMSLARAVATRAAVDEDLARAVAAGASLVKPAQDAPVINGYHGYVADPDGFLWEIAYNPGFRFDADGRARFPGTDTRPTDGSDDRS